LKIPYDKGHPPAWQLGKGLTALIQNVMQGLSFWDVWDI